MNTNYTKHWFLCVVIMLFLLIIFTNGFMLQAQTSNPVGAIPGVIDVSPMGAATYTIPIEVVPGTMGMQPNLSVVYNSFSGMGLLGMKWGLAGLSAITRCGQTPYYDNNITAIEFSRLSNSSRFTLDGNRLLRINNGEYYEDANGEYATEMENFMRIYLHKGFHPILFPPILLPYTAHFTVYTDDGSILEYGNTADSKQTVNSGTFYSVPSILSWYINRITDANGNYMTFHYGRGETNTEILIDKIEYTGNSSNDPYAKVMFSYRDLPDNFGKNTYFVDGYGISQTKLLETITVSYKHKYYNDVATNQKHFLSVVDSLKRSNGIGTDLNTFQYLYQNFVFSLPKRTFLGFKEFICINHQENKKDAFLFSIDNSKHSRIPVSQKTYYDNVNWNEKTYNFSFINLGDYRYMPYFNEITAKDILYDIKTITTTTLNNNTGRLEKRDTKTYGQCNASTNNWLHSEIKTYSDTTITLNGYQKKTVPTQILTTQQFRDNGTLNPIIADTLTYSYYFTGSNKGRLNWERQGNADGSITTSYDGYSAIGVYWQKTVSAAGCTPRSEGYDYDPIRRFTTLIRNPEGHETTFTYDNRTGNKLSETDPNGLTTTYSYDAFGNLTQIDYPDDTPTDISIDWYANANLPNACYYTTITSTGKPPLELYYDMLGREVCRLEDGYFFKTIYNTKGQIVKTLNYQTKLTSPENEGIIREYTYDNFGRKVEEKAPYVHLSHCYQGRNVTVTDHWRDILASKSYDALGRIISAEDIGGVITYKYAVIDENNKKRPQTTIKVNNTAATTILSDLWGNRLSIDEPNAGTIISTYNGFNELLQQTDARGNTTSYQYDKLGRITQKQFTGTTPQTINYFYDNTNYGIGKLYKIQAGEIIETLTYNDLGRLSQHKKLIDATEYTYHYTYNRNGQLHTLTYPSNFGVTYSYTETGKLNDIRRSNNNALIYRVLSRNKYQLPTHCEYGNNLATDYKYNTYGLLTRINTGNKITIGIGGPILEEPHPDIGGGIHGKTEVSGEAVIGVDSAILNYRYAYDNKGLMISRSESIIDRLEEYEYDLLDRLTEITSGDIGAGTMQTQTLLYHKNGNIIDNSNVGYYTYGSKPHAVTQVDLNNNAISHNQCEVIYNSFNQPTQITEGGNLLDFFYGTNQQRYKSVRYREADDLEITRYYVDKGYETDITVGSTGDDERQYHYIYGTNGVVALYITDLFHDPTGNGEDPRYTVTTVAEEMYYIHTDHLGSYCAITDANKEVIQRNYFDPWGNHKQLFKNRGIPPEDPQADTIINFTLTYRGFTGHEHYPYFKIINMNGRLYDPVIGRFFSPDNYVQLPEFTQGYNRYSYARNNPLMYTDPSGEFLITFLVNGIIGAKNGEGFWKRGGESIANHFKIIGGLFTTDKNRTGGGQFWEFVSRFTWQGIQTAVGHIYSQFANMVGQIDKVSYKAGATVMSGNFWGTGHAVTLGNYIHGDHYLEPKFDNWLFQHEYGHYLQSQAVGPLYFQRYGLPSAFSGGPFKYNHNSHPAEQDANARALKYFSTKVPNFNSFDEKGNYTGQWDFDYNRIIGYDRSLPFNDPMNQKALKYARLQPAWHDWVLGPNILISMFIDWPVLNSKKRYHNKLELMEADGFDIPWYLW